MIIVEGPDGCGKTTLCAMLSQHNIVNNVLPSPRIPAKGDENRMKYETERYLRLYGNNHQVAVDRFLFSEMAYGSVLRGRSAFSKAEYFSKLLDLFLSGSSIIFCLPDKPKYKATESEYIISNMPAIRAVYETLVEDSAVSNPRTYIYKWNEPNAFAELRKKLETK